MVTETGLAIAAIDAFARDGELTGLALLADYLAEVGDYHGERRVRVLLARDAERQEAVRFFLRMTSLVKEGLDSLKSAMESARIERWKEECCEVEWLVDEDYNREDYDDPGESEIAFGCIVRWYAEGVPTTQDRTLTESLWCIDFEPGYDPTYSQRYPSREANRDGNTNYQRLVETELAEELFGQVMEFNA